MSGNPVRQLEFRMLMVAAATIAILVSLSGCAGYFDMGDRDTYAAADGIASEVHVATFGEVGSESRWGTGVFSDPPTLEYVVLGPTDVDDLSETLEAAGFTELTLSRTATYTEWYRGPSSLERVTVKEVLAGNSVYLHSDGGDSVPYTPSRDGLWIQISVIPDHGAK